MGADFSRVRLNPLRDYAGVELKQGGVLIDADANELMGIVDRHLRALASDVLGRARVSAVTPNAFKITASAGALQIGRGRLYVDGLLAENHGASSTDPGKREFDELLAELRFSDPLDYSAQPYLPVAPKLPSAGRHLVYLDVWNREVTHLQQPDLVETAVGVETSSRVQTVWQVHALAEEAGRDVTCASPDGDIAGWPELIAPSTGVLSTGTFEDPEFEDPCELPPSGGYRGLENQLYRVEIHHPGQPGGGATFKFSRENVSVASAVASVISATVLELASLGRDDVLGFKTAIGSRSSTISASSRKLPDRCGGSRSTRDCGRSRSRSRCPARCCPSRRAFPTVNSPAHGICGCDAGTKAARCGERIRAGPPFEVENLDAPNSRGVIAVPSPNVTLLLEQGITVTFDSTGTKGFRAGDYWVFAARTADASVEILDRAPPPGIHHHYARLAIWDVASGVVADCRPTWPPSQGARHDCSCTACVTVESHNSEKFTIQDAVNQVSPTGGSVCLGPGQYLLKAPVHVGGARSLTIRGHGPATVIVSPGGAFLLKDNLATALENLAILSLGKQSAITVSSALGLNLRKLEIVVVTPDAVGAAISLGGVLAGARISENVIVAKRGVVANDPAAIPTGEEFRPDQLFVAALSIEDNVFWCQRQAINLDGPVLHFMGTHINRNEIAECRDVALSALGRGMSGSSVAITHNVLNVAGSGIRAGLDGLRIESNKVASSVGRDDARKNATVGIALLTGFNRDGADQSQVLANQIDGFGRAGILLNALVRQLIVKLNIIQNCDSGIRSTVSAFSDSVSIENNHVSNIGSEEGHTDTLVAIGVARATVANIVGNTMRSIGTRAVRAPLRAAILAFGVSNARVRGNEVLELAPAGDFVGTAAGILLLAPYAQFDVSANQVQRDLTTTTADSNGAWFALRTMDGTLENPLARVGSLAALRIDEARTLMLDGGRLVLATSGGTAAAPARAPARGSVLGNVFNGRGAAAAAEVRAGGECLFNDNRVEALANDKIAVLLVSDAAIANANIVRGGKVSIQVEAKSAAVLGNITTNGVTTLPTPLDSPWKELNLTI